MTDSAVLQIMRLVYRRTPGGSYQRLNSALQASLEMLIKSKMRFKTDDIATIFDTMKGRYWFGTDNEHSQGEWFYALACKSKNTSACESFEAWYGRKPFIVDGQRWYVGLTVQGRTITSFAKDQSHAVACTYHYEEQEHNGNTYRYKAGVKTLDKISHADIRAWNKAQRDEE